MNLSNIAWKGLHGYSLCELVKFCLNKIYVVNLSNFAWKKEKKGYNLVNLSNFARKSMQGYMALWTCQILLEKVCKALWTCQINFAWKKSIIIALWTFLLEKFYKAPCELVKFCSKKIKNAIALWTCLILLEKVYKTSLVNFSNFAWKKSIRL